MTTELSGNILALVTLSHWYENVFLLGVVGLFIINSSWWSIPAAIVVCLLAFLLETLIDIPQGKMADHAEMDLDCYAGGRRD